MALSEKQMIKRHALMAFWYLGHCTAARELGQEVTDEPSTLAHVLFCPFIHVEHPHLRLNREEIAVAESLDLEKMMPARLREEIGTKLADTARQTGLPSEFLLAAAYGYALANVTSEKRPAGTDVLRAVMKAISDSFEKSIASGDYLRAEELWSNRRAV